MTKGRGAKEKANPQIALLAKANRMLDPRVIIGGKKNIATGMLQEYRNAKTN